MFLSWRCIVTNGRRVREDEKRGKSKSGFATFPSLSLSVCLVPMTIRRAKNTIFVTIPHLLTSKKPENDKKMGKRVQSIRESGYLIHSSQSVLFRLYLYDLKILLLKRLHHPQLFGLWHDKNALGQDQRLLLRKRKTQKNSCLLCTLVCSRWNVETWQFEEFWNRES